MLEGVTRWRLAAVLGILTCGYIAWTLFLPNAGAGRNDFLGFYAGGRLAGTAGLYNAEAVRAAQLQAIGEWSPSMQFIRLPYYALLLKPLALLPYRTAYLAFEALSLGSLLVFLLLWPDVTRSTKWVVCCWSLPLFVCLFDGEDTTFLLLWIALAVQAQRRGKPALAGALLALCASKYHLVILVPLVILAQRRWRMAAGGAAAGSVLVAVSFAVAGAQWPWRYLTVLASPHTEAGMNSMPNLHALLGTAPLAVAAGWEIASAAVLAAVVFVAARRDPGFERPLAIALAAGILVSIHSYLMDCVLLWPAILMMAEAAAPPPARVAAWILATPFPWFMLKLPAPLPDVTRLLIIFLVAGSAWAARTHQEPGFAAVEAAP